MVLRKTAREIMNTRVCAVSLYMLKHLELQSYNRKTAITHNSFRHCRVRFYTFVGQPLSKQLYTQKKDRRPSWLTLISSHFDRTSLVNKGLPRGIKDNISLLKTGRNPVLEPVSELDTIFSLICLFLFIYRRASGLIARWIVLFLFFHALTGTMFTIYISRSLCSRS